MNYEIVSYLTVIGLVVFGIVKNSLSFKPIRFHCDNYVLNTYLYFILSWAISQFSRNSSCTATFSLLAFSLTRS